MGFPHMNFSPFAFNCMLLKVTYACASGSSPDAFFKMDPKPELRIVLGGQAILGGYENGVRLASAETIEMAVSLSMEELCQLSAQLHFGHAA